MQKRVKLTAKQEQIKKAIRPLVESILREEDPTQMGSGTAPNKKLDAQEVKAIATFIDGMSTGSYLRHQTNDKTVLDIYDQVDSLRMKLMDYVKNNSDYEYRGKSPNGWKWIKKGKTSN